MQSVFSAFSPLQLKKHLTETTLLLWLLYGPGAYVLKVRSARARALLESRSTASVKAADGSVGFRDVEYFSKQFRTRFGKVPSEYLG